jgi:cell cycle sensor histidine kinase DivJ
VAVAKLLTAITPATRRGLLLAANRCRRTGQPAQAEFELVLPGGEHRFYATRLRRQRRALLGVIQDITDRQRAQDALLTAKREAEQASAAKSAFLATMTHELRTPLNAILGYSEVMRDALLGDIPPRYADYAKSIHEAGTHLLSLINDVLDMARLEAGRHPLQLSATDLDVIAREALTYVAPSVLTANIALGIDSPGPLLITADRRAIRQVLINLLANAVKFTPAGGAVTIVLARIEGGVTVEVIDTGIGIAPDRLARLGRPFEQAHDQGPDVAHTGSGLGLAISRALVEQHGGSLTVSSTQGVGTRVRVVLPTDS